MANNTISFPSKEEVEGKFTKYTPPIETGGALPFPTTQTQMAEYQEKYTFDPTAGKWFEPPTAPTITADDLTTPTTPVDVPVLEDTDIPTVAPLPTMTTTDTTSDYLKTYLEEAEKTKPVSPIPAYEEAEKAAGIPEKEEAFTESQRAVKAAQSELDFISADIARIVGETQVKKLQIAKEPISAGAIAGRNITEERNLAIRAIPLQAQALVAQAKIASAQGDEIIAQNTLKMAQDRLDKVFGMQMDFQESLRTFNNDLRAAVYDYATKKEQDELDAQKEADDRAYDLMRDQIDYAQSVAKGLLQTQPDLAAKIGQINWSKPGAADEFARLQTQITPEVELLSVAEAKNLGVPYGTTKAQAYGITPTTGASYDARLNQEISNLYSGRYGIEGSREEIIKILQAEFPDKDISADIYRRIPDGYEAQIRGAAEPTPSKWEQEGTVWQWLETDEAKALSDDEKASQIRAFGLNPEIFGIY